VSAIVENVKTQVWYVKNGIVTTYSGHWIGPVHQGKNGPYQLFKIDGIPADDIRGPYRTFTLRNIVKVCEGGKQVYPVVRKMMRASNGRFVRA